LPLNLELAPKLLGNICDYFYQKFHALFSTEADYITFLSGETKTKNITTKEI
jgi:hypothetical protein